MYHALSMIHVTLLEKMFISFLFGSVEMQNCHITGFDTFQEEESLKQRVLVPPRSEVLKTSYWTGSAESLINNGSIPAYTSVTLASFHSFSGAVSCCTITLSKIFRSDLCQFCLCCRSMYSFHLNQNLFAKCCTLHRL